MNLQVKMVEPKVLTNRDAKEFFKAHKSGDAKEIQKVMTAFTYRIADKSLTGLKVEAAASKVTSATSAEKKVEKAPEKDGEITVGVPKRLGISSGKKFGNFVKDVFGLSFISAGAVSGYSAVKTMPDTLPAAIIAAAGAVIFGFVLLKNMFKGENKKLKEQNLTYLAGAVETAIREALKGVKTK